MKLKLSPKKIFILTTPFILLAIFFVYLFYTRTSADVIDPGVCTIDPAPDGASGTEKDIIASTEECQGEVCAEAADNFVEVSVSPSVNEAPSDTQTNIPINLSIYNPDSPDVDLSVVDHVSVFATGAGKTFKPDNNDAGKALICSVVGTVADPTPKDPISRYIQSESCDADGDCGSVTFTSPSEVGPHQIFAVAMKSASGTLCAPENIAGWSIADDSQLINVYGGEVVHGDILTISYPSPMPINKEFNIRVQTDQAHSTLPINHVSILIGKKDSVAYEDITDDKVCTEAGKSATDCLLCFQQSVICPADGNCDANVPITLTQTGQHRIVAVAMSNALACTASGAEDNLITKNIEGIITATSVSDPGGGGGDGGGGGGGGGDTPPPVDPIKLTNPSIIDSVSDLINKITFWVFSFIGLIAFFAFIVAGFTYMSAGGDESKMAKAKKAMVYAIVGLVIAVLAYGVVWSIFNMINKWHLPSAHSVQNCIAHPRECMKF